jgi:superfamily II DNA or RNA helicase
VGIDIPTISALLICSESGSEITVIQMIGRALRMAPGKKNAVICDMIVNKPRWEATARKRAMIAKRYEI